MTNSKEYKISVLQQLKDLKELALDGSVENPDLGVCDNIRISIDCEYFISWPLYSGDDTFPVFDKNNGTISTPYKQYHMIDNLWEGRQLELRLDLLDHLIKCYKMTLFCLGHMDSISKLHAKKGQIDD